MQSTRKIILASKSPRRSQILREAGFEFEIKTQATDESFPEDLPVREVAQYLAEKKARGVEEFLEKDTVIITSDTTVILGNTIFGKPKDEADAFGILRQLSGKAHEVITGVCLLSQHKVHAFSATSTVYFDEFTDDEIRHYIRTYQPFDKAGAYGIQEWVGLCKIKKIEGTYSNIMGLPMRDVYEALQNF
ncbi:MAG: Maf family protein [Bacteroidota bacterium]